MAAQLETLPEPDEPPIVFVSYSHEDEDWKDKLLPLSVTSGEGVEDVSDPPLYRYAFLLTTVCKSMSV
jgi:hypothetical protein